MNFGFQNAIEFVRSLSEQFLIPRRFFSKPEEITSLFNRVVDRVSHEQKCVDSILSFFPVFYALLDTQWQIDSKPIFSSMEGHHFHDSFLLQDQLEKNSGCASISKSFLKLNGTKYNFCVKICCSQGLAKIVIEDPGILAFYVPASQRLSLFVHEENFLKKYASFVLFQDQCVSPEIKQDPFLYQFCKNLFPSITQHTVYLQQENDVLYYIFSASVIDYNPDASFQSRYGLGGLFVVLRGNWQWEVLSQPSFEEKGFVEACRSIINRLSACILIYYYLQLSQKKALMSAIGSIMSRNGSHNIGSHVLAALSHHVGTMPDDRVLYQYIQHRMDYIATATTEQPSWRLPTMFVAGLMKEFVRQRHLLDYIGGSEGLHAYMFQGQSNEREQQNTIRLHVRRILALEGKSGKEWEVDGFLSDKENVVDFVKYDGAGTVDFSKDMAVAIPGGIVGQHAFYTILENILRNAAKHEWADMKRVWNIANDVLGAETCKDEFQDCCPKWLDVYIDFRDNCEQGKVEVRIWNDRVTSVRNMARINTAIIDRLRKDPQNANRVSMSLWNWYRVLKNQNHNLQDNPVFCLVSQAVDSLPKERRSSPEEVSHAIEIGLQCRSDLSTKDFFDFLESAIAQHERAQKSALEEKIAWSFIDENGTLRKENWGIAEMRISAGFLECRDIGQIGGMPGAGSPLDIIRPVLVANKNLDPCIGYRFDMDKPKLLLVVLDLAEMDLASVNRIAAQFGVRFVFDCQLTPDGSYPYSYVLFENLSPSRIENLKSGTLALPFRILYWKSSSKGSVPPKFFPEYVGHFFENLASNLATISSSSELAAGVCHGLLEDVYADWLDHVHSLGSIRARRVVLDIDGGNESGGSAQTLISRAELLSFVFANSFNSAIRSFLKANEPGKGTGSFVISHKDGKQERLVSSLPARFAVLLYAVAAMPYRRISSLDELARRFHKQKDVLAKKIDLVIILQLNLWMAEVLNGEYVETENLRSSVDSSYWINEFLRERRVYVGSLKELQCDPDCRYWMQRFRDYIATDILDQADSFLRKYEERFATLPSAFKMDPGKGQQEWEWEIAGRFIEHVRFSSDATVRNAEKANGAICYFRHGTEPHPQIGEDYYEPMSGAQGTLNAFISLRRDIDAGIGTVPTEARCRAVGFVTRMVENAALRVLIVDERVTKFMREHQDVCDLIGGLRLAVADDNDPGVMEMFSHFSPENPPSFSNVKLTDFEIVIVHQGIVDKLLHGHEDKAVVKAWMESMIQRLHYVVITTGRGSPANIPDTARVLPYSVIESSILQRYPEKMILVDAVMNILPGRKKQGADR